MAHKVNPGSTMRCSSDVYGSQKLKAFKFQQCWRIFPDREPTTITDTGTSLQAGSSPRLQW